MILLSAGQVPAATARRCAALSQTAERAREAVREAPANALCVQEEAWLRGVNHAIGSVPNPAAALRREGAARMHQPPVESPTRLLSDHGWTLAAAVAAGLLVLGLVGPARGEPEALEIVARSFQRGDASVLAGYGEPLSIGGVWAEYDFEIAMGGSFVLAARYAAGESRPVRLSMDGVLFDDRAMAGNTGSFVSATGRWEDLAVVRLQTGKHTLRIERDPCLPHIASFRLTPTAAPAGAPVLVHRQAALIALLADLEGALKAIPAPAATELLQQVADLGAAVRQVDPAVATADATKAMGDLAARVSALRVPVAGLRTEALTGSRHRVVAWAGDPLVKVFRDTLLPETARTDGVEMEACLNTYEAAVVCVSSFDYAGPLRATAGLLVNADGGPSLTEITTRFVGCVPSPKNTPGWPDVLRAAPASYPDPLLLDPEVALQPRHTQSVWVTVRVPADARPGEYSGSITLATAAAPATVVPLRLRVYRPALPNVPSFQMGFWGGDTFLANAAAGKPREQKSYDDAYFAYLKDECLRDRFEHRALVFSDVPLWSVFSTCGVSWRDGQYAFDYALFDRFISTVEEAMHGSFRVICVGIAAGTSQDKTQLLSGDIAVTNADGSPNAERSFANVPTDDPRYREFLGGFMHAMQEHLRAKEWLGKVYFKVLDEVSGGTVPAALRLRAHIKSCAPGIRLDETILDGAVLDQEHVDLPIVCTFLAPGKLKRIAELAAQGREVWTYNSYLIMVDLPTVHTSILGWVSYLYGLKGYMHWAWAWKPDAWESAYTEGIGAGGGLPGVPRPGAQGPRLHPMGASAADLAGLRDAAHARREGRRQHGALPRVGARLQRLRHRPGAVPAGAAPAHGSARRRVDASLAPCQPRSPRAQHLAAAVGEMVGDATR